MFKAQFYARVDQQIEGIYFFDIYAPIIQWTTIGLKLILEVLLELKSQHGSITIAFLHENLEEA